MDFDGSFGVLWRRKGLTFALLILTLVGTGFAGIILPWRYNASITETLLNSEGSSKTLGGGNPYLSFDSSMVDMANILALRLTNDTNTLALQQNGYTASFQAQVLSENPETEEPFIQISVEGDNKEAVARTLQGVTAGLSVLLMQVQEGVPVKSRLSLQTIAETSAPVPSSSAKIKPLVGFLAVGLILTFLIPQAAEGSVARRRKIRAGATVTVDDRPRSRDFGERAESDQFDFSHAAETGRETFEQQWSAQQLDDNSQGQRVSPMRQGGGVQSPFEYGVLGLDEGRHSETERGRHSGTERRWLCSFEKHLRELKWAREG
jgi:capsular polysaccharide biosynthesis protein